MVTLDFDYININMRFFYQRGGIVRVLSCYMIVVTC